MRARGSSSRSFARGRDREGAACRRTANVGSDGAAAEAAPESGGLQDRGPSNAHSCKRVWHHLCLHFTNERNGGGRARDAPPLTH